MLIETTKLVQQPIPIPDTLAELISSSSGSAAGYSAVSSWLVCPEQSRLKSRGVIPKPRGWEDDELSALSLGTLVHALRAIRIAYGHETAIRALDRWAPEIDPPSYEKVRMLMLIYNQRYPLEAEPFDIIGIEQEVMTDLGDGNIRTVRYDTLMRDRQYGDIFTFEAKTTARSGRGAMNPYTPQAMCQVAIWNRNKHLVAEHGPMKGVVWDTYVKTKVPDVERFGPQYISLAQQEIAVRYMKLPGNGALFSKEADGTYPKMLHACWGRFRPCDYIACCHEGAIGEYQYRNGDTYDGK